MRAAFRHPGWHWIGILLVLFNLLAPSVSHAVRHAQAGGMVSVQDLCSAAHGDQASTSAADDAALKSALDACGFCSAGLLGSAAPLPTPGAGMPQAVAAAAIAYACPAVPAAALTPIAAAPQAP